MKKTSILLALTLSLSAFTALAQSQGDQAKQLKDRPHGADIKKDRDKLRNDDSRPQRFQRRDQTRQREMERRDWAGPGPRFAPGRPGYGPQEGFGPGRPFRAPQGPGQPWGRPGFAPRDSAGLPEVCPRCGRPSDMNMQPRGMQRGGRGFGPRQHFGPTQPGFGPEGRGPAFGPPPWAGRGGPDEDWQGPRGPRRELPPMQGRGFGPTRRTPDRSDDRKMNREDDARRDLPAPRERRPSE